MDDQTLPPSDGPRHGRRADPLDFAGFVLGVVRWVITVMTRRPGDDVWGQLIARRPPNEAPTLPDWEAELVAEYADTSLGRRIMARLDRIGRRRASVAHRPLITPRVRGRSRTSRTRRTRPTTATRATAPPSDPPAPGPCSRRVLDRGAP